METNAFFTGDEKSQLSVLYRKLLQLSGETLRKGDCRKLKSHLIQAVQDNHVNRDVFGLNPIIKDMQTAVIVAEEIGMRRASILGIMLHGSVHNGTYTAEQVAEDFGEDVAGIIRGLIRVNELYAKSPTVESENFRNLLLSFAEDMRVILIMIADRVNVMRQIKDCPDDEARRQVANEAAYLYAPLAHKLGLYKLKSELEDLSLKYTEHDVYYHIKDKLNATKAARDRYIAAFIAPVKQKLEEAGLTFHIKGRTKSIHSIYQKMKKQKCPFEGVYDLFAIRIILDSPQVATSRCTSPLWVPKASGWKCRSAPNAWMTSPSAVWPPIGDTKVSKARPGLTNGLPPYAKPSKVRTPILRRWIASSSTCTKTRYLSLPPKATFSSCPRVLPYSTLPLPSTPSIRR